MSKLNWTRSSVELEAQLNLFELPLSELRCGLKKSKLAVATILGGLTICLANGAQADLGSGLRLSGGDAKLFYVESGMFSEGPRPKFDTPEFNSSVDSFLELKEGETRALEVHGGCSVTLQKNFLFVSLVGSDINLKFSGSKYFSLRGASSPATTREVAVSGHKGSRFVRGISVTKVSSGAPYSEVTGHAVERFCQNFVEQSPGFQTRSFLVGNETAQFLVIDESSNSIMISEEGTCNGTRHKAIVTCQLPANQTLADFVDYQQLQTR